MKKNIPYEQLRYYKHTNPDLTKIQNLDNLKEDDQVMVHAYKYNGWLYRSWSNPKVVFKKDDMFILCSTNAYVISSEEKSVRSFPSYNKKLTYWYFFKDEWFNIIATIENNGIKLYINVASPFIYEEGAIKYIDFDLDFTMSVDGNWNEIDINEFIENARKYNYEDALIKKIILTEKKIIHCFKNNLFSPLINKENLLELHMKYGSPEPVQKQVSKPTIKQNVKANFKTNHHLKENRRKNEKRRKNQNTDQEVF